jgi:hypothetical protein
LEASFGEDSITRYSLRKVVVPVEDGARLRWQSKALGITGVWERLDPAFDAQIYASREGDVNWHCVHPRASAEVTLGHGVVLRGIGYVERLVMTIEPWKLPLDELHWGRFLSDSDSLVWIDWQGTRSYRLVLKNGVPRNSTRVDEMGIALEGNEHLFLRESAVLRTGALGKTGLRGIPGLSQSFPAAVLNIRECKWRSRGEFVGGKSESSGWAIHEVVNWPR